MLFFQVIDDHLVMFVKGADGRGYVHRCERESFGSVAWAFEEECPPSGYTLKTLAQVTGAPMTQVNVALAFLKERGCIITRFRRHYPASTFLFEDAMIEYLALAEGGESAEYV